MPQFLRTCSKTSFAYQGHRRFRKGYGNHVFASLRALVVADPTEQKRRARAR